MPNDTMFEFIRATAVAIWMGIIGGSTHIPWIQVGTFFTIILNFSYVVYKWRKSELFNRENMKQAKLRTLILEKELANLENRA